MIILRHGIIDQKIPAPSGGGGYPTADLEARWQFENTMTDEINSYDWAAYDTPGISYWDYESGLVGDCLHSSGHQAAGGSAVNTTLYGVIGNNLAHTLSFWFKYDVGATGTDAHIFTTNDNPTNNYYIYLSVGTNLLRWQRHGTAIAGNPSATWTDWNMITTTYDGAGAMELFFNATSIDTGSDNASIGNDIFYLNYYNNTTNSRREIAYDQMYAYSRVLSQAEIDQLYNGGSGV